MENNFKFKPFDKVLVCYGNTEWTPTIFSHFTEDKDYPYNTLSGSYRYCIPYEGNECLAGTIPKKEDLPYEPKDGDFVYARSALYSYIFIKNGSDKLTGKYISLNITLQDLSSQCPICCEDKDIISIRAAFDEERDLLLSKMHKRGMDWDEEKKEIVKYRWLPALHENYYFFDSQLSVCCCSNNGDILDKERLAHRNCFQTEDKAWQAIAQIKQILNK